MRFLQTVLIVACLVLTACAGPTLSPKEAQEKIRDGALVVDVRTEEEFQSGHLPQALNIPHDEITKHLSDLPPDREIVLYCRSGTRSGRALKALQDEGYDKVYNGGGYTDLKEE